MGESPTEAMKIGVPRELLRYALPVEKRRGRPDTGASESVKVFDPEPRNEQINVRCLPSEKAPVAREGACFIYHGLSAPPRSRR